MEKMFSGTMFKTLVLAALFFSFAAANLCQVPLGSSEPPTDDDLEPRRDDASWMISRSTAYDMLEGPNNFSSSPSDPINSIKIDPLINKMNWEPPISSPLLMTIFLINRLSSFIIPKPKMGFLTGCM
ncbi:hypothetical protein FQN50_001920 [Emmonsiellopsis sp. PD_5]|nr:hypothetical protein FQN50_001920 [Emmonsiellopsis sp. PD_5]